MDVRRQHRTIATRERHWSTLARKEGISNLAQSRRNYHLGNRVLGKMYATEARWDFQWARKRQRIARRESG